MKTSIISTFAALLMTASAVSAQEKIALVISNSEYRLIPSHETAHDTTLSVVSELEAKGFQVTLVHNTTLGFHTFNFNNYQARLQAAADGSVGVVYYAGHGVSQDGVNFLLPVDIASDGTGSLATTAIDAASLIPDLSGETGKQAYVIIDCCVANPLDPDAAGLVAMAPTEGARVVFAAPEGEVLEPDASFTLDLITALAPADATLESALDQVDPTMPVTAEPVVEDPAPVETPEPDAVADAAPVEEITPEVAEVVEEVAPPIVEETVAAAEAVTEDTAEAPSDVPTETSAWDATKESMSSADLIAFLGQYPNGAFADEAKGLLVQVLAAEQSDTPLSVPVEAIVADSSDIAADIAADVSDAAAPTPPVLVTYSTPLVQGDPAIIDKTIAELIESSPLFPPVEGLPDEYWKEKTCTACHTWEQANLCDQANTYLTEAGSANLTKQHPFGGTFKMNLRDWAVGGCTP